MGTTKFTVKIVKDEDGSFYAEVFELPWCFTTGANIEELKKNSRKISIRPSINCPEIDSEDVVSLENILESYDWEELEIGNMVKYINT